MAFFLNRNLHQTRTQGCGLLTILYYSSQYQLGVLLYGDSSSGLFFLLWKGDIKALSLSFAGKSKTDIPSMWDIRRNPFKHRYGFYVSQVFGPTTGLVDRPKKPRWPYFSVSPQGPDICVNIPSLQQIGIEISTSDSRYNYNTMKNPETQTQNEPTYDVIYCLNQGKAIRTHLPFPDKNIFNALIGREIVKQR
jgi:hypothetical protein